jgi:hypothetical protein
MHDETHEHVHHGILVETERQQNLRHCQRQPMVDEAGLSVEVVSQLSYNRYCRWIVLGVDIGISASHSSCHSWYSRFKFPFHRS